MLPIFDNTGNILDKELYESRFISERSFAWEDKFRRILVRYDWYVDLYHAFHLLAFSMINFRNVQMYSFKNLQPVLYKI